MVGRSFTAVTVSRKLVEAVAWLSLTVTVIVAVPLWFGAGVTVTVRFAPVPPKTMLATGTRVELVVAPVSVRLPAAVSASPTVTASAPVPVSSGTVCGPSAEIVGAVLGPVTVSRKLVEAVAWLSLTVTVIVAVPVWFGAGVTVTVRLAPVPPKTMLATGTRVELVVAPVSVRLPAAVSASPTVSANGPTAVPAGVV